MDPVASPPPIPHSRPTLGPEDQEAVAAVLTSGHIAEGEQVAFFEEEIAKSVGAAGGVATSSGTAALHLALRALNVGEGDEVILPSYVCAAVLHAVHYVGATPRLADCDPRTFNLDPNAARRVAGRRTKAIIVPHLFGLPADLDALIPLGIPLIEDCAQTVGATLQGKPVGSIGEVTVFSFYATKVLTTGEGGMLTSPSASFVARARDLREYDEKKDYQVRYNYKMTDLQAALGRSQLKRLPQFLAARRALALSYTRAFADLPLLCPGDSPGRPHTFYRYVVRAAQEMVPRLLDLTSRGVTCRRPVFWPLHRALGLTGFAGTEEAWETAVSLPLYPSLGADQERVIQAVRNLYGEG